MTYWKINSKKRRLLAILVFPFVFTSALIVSIFPANYSDGRWCLSTIGSLIVYSLMIGVYLFMLWHKGIIMEWVTGKHRSYYLYKMEEKVNG